MRGCHRKEWSLCMERIMYRSAAVTVTGRSDAGAPLWFEITGNAPSAPTMSPRLGPSAVSPVQGWKQYPAYFYVARAGCYTLRASWPGDGWAVRFAAGK